VRVRLADESAFTHDGKMNFVDNQLSARSGTVRGRAVLSNTSGLFTPGIFGRLQLFGGDVDALLIPDSAVISDQARKIVFTIDADDTIVATPVVLGSLNDGLRIVRTGLDTTKRVVIEGIANPAVRPGAKVTPTLEEIKPPAAPAK
jgi:membrane fusion protein, multidrug efflux system